MKFVCIILFTLITFFLSTYCFRTRERSIKVTFSFYENTECPPGLACLRIHSVRSTDVWEIYFLLEKEKKRMEFLDCIVEFEQIKIHILPLDGIMRYSTK
jgi:hypothetical protein